MCWKSRTQDLVSLSSTESELIAVDEAVRELRFLLKLMRDFDIPVEQPALMGQDNMSTIRLIESEHSNLQSAYAPSRTEIPPLWVSSASRCAEGRASAHGSDG